MKRLLSVVGVLLLGAAMPAAAQSFSGTHNSDGTYGYHAYATQPGVGFVDDRILVMGRPVGLVTAAKAPQPSPAPSASPAKVAAVTPDPRTVASR